MEIYSIINTLITLFLGGGWFIYYRANKRKAEAEAKQQEAIAKEQEASAKQQEANAFKAMQDTYQQTLEDVNKTLAEVRLERDKALSEVRAERDHYKDERNELRKENHDMRVKYNELEDKVARLGRRLDCLSPFLCGVVGCMHRQKVSLMENIDDNSFATIDERNEQKNEE